MDTTFIQSTGGKEHRHIGERRLLRVRGIPESELLSAVEPSPRARQRAYRAEIWNRRHLEQLAFRLGMSPDLLRVAMDYLDESA